MSSSINQSGFLSEVAEPTFIRPPWSLPEPLFLALCTGCSDCRDECPRGLLQKSVDGFPVVDFSQGACHFCGECVEACAQGALTRSYRGASWGPWRLKAYIAGDCLGSQGVVCRQCVRHCAALAIRLSFVNGNSVPRIDTQLCTGCGACLNSCPAEAIGLYADPSL